MTKEEHFLFSRASGTNIKKVDWGGLEKNIHLYFYDIFSVDEMHFHVIHKCMD
jgi:hypothetical protein